MTDSTGERLYEFKFWTGERFQQWGWSPRDALYRLGLSAYNPVAYRCVDITPTRVGPEHKGADNGNHE